MMDDLIDDHVEHDTSFWIHSCTVISMMMVVMMVVMMMMMMMMMVL